MNNNSGKRNLPLQDIFDALYSTLSEANTTGPGFPATGEAQDISSLELAGVNTPALPLLTALARVFNPQYVVQIGTISGERTLDLLKNTGPGAQIWTFCSQELDGETIGCLQRQAEATGNQIETYPLQMLELVTTQGPVCWREITQGKATFAFLDQHTRFPEDAFEYLSDPANGILDFSYPLCVCIHRFHRDQSQDASNRLVTPLGERMEAIVHERGWQALHLFRSAALLVLVKYPAPPRIAEGCLIPEALLTQADIELSSEGEKPYLLSDYYPLLANLIGRKQPRTLVILGLHDGYSLAVMLDAASSIQRVLALDTEGTQEEATSSPLKKETPANAQQILMEMWQQGRWPQLEDLSFLQWNAPVSECPALDGLQIDFAYIDGVRTPERCLQAFTLLWPHMASEGILVGDQVDACKLGPSLVEWATAHQCFWSYVPDKTQRGRMVVARSKQELDLVSLREAEAPEDPMDASLSEVHRFDPTTKSEVTLLACQVLLSSIYTYERVGYDSRSMTFLADGKVGVGAAGCELFWDVLELEGQLLMEIASTTEVTCRLLQDEQGIWRGRWLRAEKMPIAVYPARRVLPNEEFATSWLPSERQRPLIRAFKSSHESLYSQTYEVRAFAQDQGNFKSVSNSNVLIYIPHGFGDWAQFSCILPLLDPTNRYFMVRFGDDYTSIMEGSPFATPIYLGLNSIHCGDGGALNNTHFGVHPDMADGSVRSFTFPLSLYDYCCKMDINAVLHMTLEEVWGASPFPYHTKERHALPSLVATPLLKKSKLRRPLPSAISFEEDPWLTNWVYNRLRNYTGYGERKLCLIIRNGYTAIGKNWGHQWREDMPAGSRREGEEARDFMRLLLRKDPRWMFLSMEDSLFVGQDTLRDEELHAFSYAEVFGQTGIATFPFGRIMKVLVNLADLAIGVPTGPYHLSMLKPELPTVGLWIEHLPSWYDEPKAASVHVVSRNALDCHLFDRPGSFSSREGLEYRTMQLDTRILPGERVLEAVETLLY